MDVGDGELSVTEFGPADAPAVLLVHGITSSSRAWLAVTRHLPGLRLIAPDLRGRGRSSRLPPSTGLRHHAADLARVLDDLGVGPIPVVGHSMGAFVAVALAAARPDAVASLVLVDGGLPLERPVGDVLGPITARLAREFAGFDEARAFWHAHPAFAGREVPDLDAYSDYDLVGEPPHLRPAATPEAIAADALDLYGPDWYLEALRGLPGEVPLLRAPRGLVDEPGGLYPELPRNPVPAVTVTDVPDCNHYTIVMTDPGAGIVARSITP
jgi:pimeloyl-ACP methyl ester carboxylesterase